MEAMGKIKIAVVALLSLGLLACDGYDGDDDEEEEESASLEQVFQSKAAFETASKHMLFS